MKRPRVLLADDHLLLLDAFERLLEPAYEIVGKVTDGIALLNAAPALKADVILIDIAMPQLSGLEAGQRLRQIMPIAKRIYLTMNDDPYQALRAMREGASGYLLKQCAVSELFKAIQMALKGGAYVSPRIARGMQEALIRDPRAMTERKEVTFRQREVLQLLAEGKSMKEAAAILGVTPRTIAFHKYTAMENLGVKTSAELIQKVVQELCRVA